MWHFNINGEVVMLIQNFCLLTYRTSIAVPFLEKGPFGPEITKAAITAASRILT